MQGYSGMARVLPIEQSINLMESARDTGRNNVMNLKKDEHLKVEKFHVKIISE